MERLMQQKQLSNTLQSFQDTSILKLLVFLLFGMLNNGNRALIPIDFLFLKKY